MNSILAVASVLALAVSVAGAGPSGSPRYWFSFGDSYTQTQFVTNGTLPSASNPMGNPPFPGYTACGSYVNWIDLVTTEYNDMEILTYNLAYGGATIDASLVTPYEPTVESMTDQVNIFLQAYQNKPASTPWTSANSVFSFFIGINDIGNSYGDGGNRTAFSVTLLDAYFGLVQNLYDVGARNFLMLNVPPINRSPLMLSQSTSAQSLEATVIAGFNSMLAERVAALPTIMTGSTAYIFDTNSLVTKLLDTPTTYGFVDAVTIGSGTNDFWCNNYHIGPGVHNYVAQGIQAELAGTGYM